jgi:hypothetical protein
VSASEDALSDAERRPLVTTSQGEYLDVFWPDGTPRRRVYVASSWRNEHQPIVVEALREQGCNVYDFRNPAPGDDGFRWSEIDSNWQAWDFDRYDRALQHGVAQRGFGLDMSALEACDVCLLVLPCGRSAHLELGFAVGARKRTAVLFPGPWMGKAFPLLEPELMYKMCDLRTDDLDIAVDFVTAPPGGWSR